MASRDCTNCGEPFSPPKSQGRPRALCDSCRTKPHRQRTHEKKVARALEDAKEITELERGALATWRDPELFARYLRLEKQLRGAIREKLYQLSSGDLLPAELRGGVDWLEPYAHEVLANLISRYDEAKITDRLVRTATERHIISLMRRTEEIGQLVAEERGAESGETKPKRGKRLTARKQPKPGRLESAGSNTEVLASILVDYESHRLDARFLEQLALVFAEIDHFPLEALSDFREITGRPSLSVEELWEMFDVEEPGNWPVAVAEFHERWLTDVWMAGLRSLNDLERLRVTMGEREPSQTLAYRILNADIALAIAEAAKAIDGKERAPAPYGSGVLRLGGGDSLGSV